MTDLQKQMADESPAAGTAPRVILPAEHPITLEMIDRDAMTVLRRLGEAGFAAYLVGGGVRDLYRGGTPKDFDISTDARPGQIRKLFRNSRTIGSRFRLVQVFFHNNHVIEVSTLRSLSEHDLDGPQAVLAPNNTFGTLDQDAQRRDLTINALFFEIDTKTIIDYVGGIADLDHSLVRIVGDPDRRINNDPVRMLRAIRHAARNNFRIEEQSWQTICEHHQKLSLCPPSRLRDELFRDLHGGYLQAWLELALNSGLLFDILPLYERTLCEKACGDESCCDQLRRVVAVIDRLTMKVKESGGQPLHHDFLIAFLLIPWANVRFDLIAQRQKGAAAFQFSKKIRLALDEEIGTQLNLPRSSRQEMVTLLTNLPYFIQHHQDGDGEGGWPKWLRKKSYFEKCALFFACWQDAVGEQAVPDKLLDVVRPIAVEKPERHDTGRGRKRQSSGGVRPAFSAKHKDGIFGLKNRTSHGGKKNR